MGIVLTYTASNGWISYSLIRSLEDEYRPLSVDDTPQGDVIVVLGGGIRLPLPPRLYPELSSSSGRLLHALRLYRAGKANRILLTGGNVFDEPGIQSASYYARELLEMVSSATHMHRSMVAFRSAGIEAVPVPVDFIAVESAAPEPLSWVPSVGALGGTTHALHEYLGRLWYRFRL